MIRKSQNKQNKNKIIMKKFLLSIFAVMLAVFSVHAEDATLSFADKAQRTSYSTSVQVWAQNGITFTNNKASSTSNVADYAKPVRLYASSNVVVDCANMTKIVFDCNSSSYATALKNSIGTTATTTVSSDKVTVTFAEPCNSFTIAKLTAQVRLDALTVTYETASEGGGETIVDVAEPTFTPASGTTFEDELNVTIVAEDGLAVYYSTDNKKSYTAGNAVNITESTTIYAYTEDADGNQSDVVSAEYTKIELKTIAEVIVAGAGNAMTTGTIVATYSRGFLLGDGTAYILVYQGASLKEEFYAGDVVLVNGPVSQYGGLMQFGTTAVVEKTGEAEVTHPNVTTMDAAAMDAYLAKPSVQYVEYTGTLSVDKEKGYYNVAIDGAKTAVGSISYPKAGIVEAEYDGDVVKVTGYTIGVSSSKYVNTMAVSVEVVEGDDTDPEEPTEPEKPENPGVGGDDDDVVTGELTDVLDRALTGVTGTSYSSWSDKKGTSGAVYAGNSAGSNESIQLRSNNSNSGIVTTVSGGKVKKILIDWNSNTATDRTLDIYGKNTAYSSPTELYATGGNGDQGTKLGSIVCGTSTELIVEGDYEFVGLRSNNGAMYLNSISIVWEVEEEEPVAETWSSFYAAMDTQIPAGVEAYIVTTANKDYVTLTQIFGTIPARTGVIFKSNPKSNTGSEELANVEGNLLEGVLMDTNKTEEAYVLGCVDGEYGFYKADMNQLDGTAWLANAGKAYLPVSALPASAQGAASFSFRFGEGTTGIDEMTEQRAESKEIYDLTGRRVEEVTAPGIYIVGGKKVLVK